MTPLTPEYWFKKVQVINGNFTKSEGHNMSVTINQGLFIFIPPPAAGDISTEKLYNLIHYRTSLTHVLIIPGLYTSIWGKIAQDCVSRFNYTCETCFWCKNMYKPLILVIFINIVTRINFKSRGSKRFLGM